MNLLRAIFFSAAFFSFASANAQDFPATEKEVREILLSGKWTIDSLGRAGKLRAAAEAGMEGVILAFKEDGTYTITLFGKDKAGRWVLADKQVNLYENRKEPDSIIKGMDKEKLVMARDDGSDLKMIFRKEK